MSGPVDLGKGPKKPFSRRSNLSNDDIIPLYVNMYAAFCDLLHVWKRMWKMIFWPEMESEFGEPGGTSQPRIPRSTPRNHLPLRFTNLVPRVLS